MSSEGAENTGSPIDRTKRPRLEGYDSDNDHDGHDDRHPKRQAVPDPETKAPHFAGSNDTDNDKQNDTSAGRARRKKWEEDASDDDLLITLEEEKNSSSTAAGSSAAATTSATTSADPVHYLAGGDDNQSSTSPSISLRSLVTMKDAGVIIGRGGKNVSEIREISTARVTISDIVQGAAERILTVMGPVKAVAKVNTLHLSFFFSTAIYLRNTQSRLTGSLRRKSCSKHQKRKIIRSKLLSPSSYLLQVTEWAP